MGGGRPAPTKIDPGVGWLAFHCSLTVYVIPAASDATVCTAAAFGEKVPASPPLSFQAITWPAPKAPPLMKMPRSWLTPGDAVQRSALALRTAFEATVGVIVCTSVLASMSVQVVPSLPSSRYCCQLTAGWV